jgi:hypothetical protein
MVVPELFEIRNQQLIGRIRAQVRSLVFFPPQTRSQNIFLEMVILFVIKDFFPLKIVKSIWLQGLALWLCLRANFPTKKVFIDDILPTC